MALDFIFLWLGVVSLLVYLAYTIIYPEKF